MDGGLGVIPGPGERNGEAPTQGNVGIEFPGFHELAGIGRHGEGGTVPEQVVGREQGRGVHAFAGRVTDQGEQVIVVVGRSKHRSVVGVTNRVGEGVGDAIGRAVGRVGRELRIFVDGLSCGGQGTAIG